MDDGENLLEPMIDQLVSLIRRFAEWIAWPVLLTEAGLYITASALLVICALAVHSLIFSLFCLRVVRPRERQNSEDLWVIISRALFRPLKLAFWALAIHLSSLPLLLLWDRYHPASSIRPTAGRLVNLALFIALSWLCYRLVDVCENRLRAWASAAENNWHYLIIPLVVKTLRVIIPMLAVITGLPLLGLPPAYDPIVAKASSLFILGAISWLLFQIVGVGEHFILLHHDVSDRDNLKARQIYTQVSILKRTLHVVITVFTLAAGLMFFEPVRNLGTSVMASAGVVGIIVGFAAQRTIANLFAGFQLALTQPIRIDDVVIVEHEWGRIEEITLTYVVVRIWDLRRLIVPLSYFIERPFQNWTRAQADILATVFLYVDYTVPVDAVRQELNRILGQSKHWDGKVCVLQVTNATEHALELRALSSAIDSGTAWELRCEIREKLILFVQRNYPNSLPRQRIETRATISRANE
jgi:small-conductance mechanosensitive channel